MPSIIAPVRTTVVLLVLAAGTVIGIASASAESLAGARVSIRHVEWSHGKNARVTRHANKHAREHTKAVIATTASVDKTAVKRRSPTKQATGSTVTTPTQGTSFSSGSTSTVATGSSSGTKSTSGTTTTSSTSGSVVSPTGVPGNWSLTFDDEFNGTSLDTSVWNPHDGWTNQNNVTDSASNVTESGGNAILTLASSTSGAEISTNTALLAVGDFAEARIDFAGNGTNVDNWPAWWASGPNWPAAGENDIAEGLGDLTVNYHSPSGAHNQGTVAGDWTGGFHTYGIYRGSNYCNVYWDGKLVKTYPTDDNGQPETLLFTMGADNTLAFGAQGQMLVDYVRVWAPA